MTYVLIYFGIGIIVAVTFVFMTVKEIERDLVEKYSVVTELDLEIALEETGVTAPSIILMIVIWPVVIFLYIILHIVNMFKSLKKYVIKSRVQKNKEEHPERYI